MNKTSELGTFFCTNFLKHVCLDSFATLNHIKEPVRRCSLRFKCFSLNTIPPIFIKDIRARNGGNYAHLDTIYWKKQIKQSRGLITLACWYLKHTI
jgi:hypothetical protein